MAAPPEGCAERARIIQAYKFPLSKMPGFTALTARRYTGLGGQDIPTVSREWTPTLTGELRKVSLTVHQTRRTREIMPLSHFDVYVKLGPEGTTQPVNQGIQAMRSQGGPDICAELLVIRRSDDGRWLGNMRVVDIPRVELIAITVARRLLGVQDISAGAVMPYVDDDDDATTEATLSDGDDDDEFTANNGVTSSTILQHRYAGHNGDL
ncbi:hypothetical protein OH76DRAFT_1485108 [Lentinus brumalis]|uniref:Uncharacterized protein n=1 Tax=Lentinus brumalis TaxID=2498619 RepID=A0A371D3D7_9APHY|nr:hypothetical protein OH76DRAFT_1485108 [Polyporus brumalis]